MQAADLCFDAETVLDVKVFINPHLHAREGYSSRSVCLSVC